MNEPQIEEYHQDGFTVSTDKSRLDVNAIHAYLSGESYWSQGIPVETLLPAIQNSLCFGVYQGERQVGFARVISDFATFAYLCDVFILDAYQGQGLGKWLMSCIIAHHSLQGLRNFLLFTRDAHGLYARYGFAPPPRPERIMTKSDPHIYQRLASQAPSP